MDFREKGTLLTFYIVPLVFYAVMGAVFSSIDPASKHTLAASMSIFAITMGAVLGMPAPLVKMRETGVLRAYKVNGIPNWALLLVPSISTALHLLVVSLMIFISSPIFFGASKPTDTALYFIVLLTVLFASIAFGLLIGVIARNQAAAAMLSQAVFLPSLLLGGLMFPAKMLPEPLMWLGMLYPATHAMKAFTALSGEPSAGLLAIDSLFYAVVIGTVVLILTIWNFNRMSKNKQCDRRK